MNKTSEAPSHLFDALKSLKSDVLHPETISSEHSESQFIALKPDMSSGRQPKAQDLSPRILDRRIIVTKKFLMRGLDALFQ